MEDTLLEGTLVRGYGSFYYVTDEQGETYTLRCKKKFRHEKMSPLVGDRVRFIPGLQDDNGWLEEILPRKNECLRPPVSNITLLMIVMAPVPEPDLLLTDRQLVRAARQDQKTVLVINKCDLDPSLSVEIRRQYAASGIPVYAVSAATGEGLEALRAVMQGELCCLTGASGVGKSTLLNALLDLNRETGEISQKIQRGKNTTRHAELLMKDGLRVLDTAGFSLLELENGMEPLQLKKCYPEFREYEGCCRFEPCYHASEPGCSVRQAAAESKIDPERLARYRILLEECKTAWRNRYD